MNKEKLKGLDVTVYIAIENSTGSIQLSDSVTYPNNPMLVFKEFENEGCWDNSKYVFNFLRGLKKNKKKQKKELELLCKENNMNYEIIKSDLIDMFKASQILNWWKNE